MILTNFYNQTPQVTTKIIIQIMGILSIADIIWIISFSGSWVHNEEDREKTETTKKFIRILGFTLVCSWISLYYSLF